MKDIASNIKKLALFNFFTEVKFYSPIIVIVFNAFLGNYTTSMSILSVMSLAVIIMEFPTGILGDLAGKKTAAILGAMCNLIGISLWALFPVYWSFLTGAFFLGTATAFFSGNNEALLYDSLKEKNLQEEFHAYLGKTNYTMQFALVFTAVLSAILAKYSMRLVLILSVFPQIISVIIAFTFVDTGYKAQVKNPFKHVAAAFKKIADNPKLIGLIFAKSLQEGLSSSSYQIQAAYFNSLCPLWFIGILRGLSNVLGALSFYFSDKIFKRFSKRVCLIASNLYGRLSSLLALIINAFASPFLFISSSAFFGVSSVANSSLMQAEFSDEERSTMGSITSFIGSIVVAVFSVLVGYLADRLSVRHSLFIIQITMFIPLFIYWRTLWKKPKLAEQDPDEGLPEQARQ
ncbi:MAG: MFS transporter [Spirochaetaceae bacterium]|nr:MFS transporter [Spirochaetaceae bacterium]